jgi:hypothetical protein
MESLTINGGAPKRGREGLGWVELVREESRV